MRSRRQDHQAIFNADNYEAITLSSSAVGLDTAKFNEFTKRVLVTIEDQTVRYRYDGTAPTTTEGHPLYDKDVLIVEGYGNLRRLKMIATGSDALAKITYES